VATLVRTFFLAINRVTGVGRLLPELLPQAIAGTMQENHRNGQDHSDIVETSEPFAITRATLNRQIISSGAISGSSKGERINREIISQPVFVVQRVVRNFLKSIR